MNAAQDLFRQNFEGSKGKQAKDYVASRGISMETARAFGVGFASDSTQSYIAYFAQRGFTKEQLLQYGLLSVSRKGEVYPAMQGRLTFPLALKNGETTNFYGRSISLDTKKKHNLLSIAHIGLEHGMAHQEVIEKKPAHITIVEGVFDAMSRYEMGDENVIAVISATNYLLTELAARHTAHIVIGFDFDVNESGQKGTQRLLKRLEGMGFFNTGQVTDATSEYMQGHPEDKDYKDWNEIWQAHPGMQAEFIS
jgi:DNA primase